MNEFYYAIGDLFQMTFEILPMLGNGPNVLLIIVIFILTVYWIKKLSDYSKAGNP